MAFPDDCRTGTNSAMQREDTSAFDMQIEGKLKRCYGGIKWLYDNHVVIPSVVLGRSGVGHCAAKSEFPSARLFWSPLWPDFGMRNFRRG